MHFDLILDFYYFDYDYWISYLPKSPAQSAALKNRDCNDGSVLNRLILILNTERSLWNNYCTSVLAHKKVSCAQQKVDSQNPMRTKKHLGFLSFHMSLFGLHRAATVSRSCIFCRV